MFDKIIDISPYIAIILTTILWLADRHDAKRPCLEVTFALVRDSLACMVLRNVGNTPLKLTSMKFNNEFINQLDDEIIDRLKSMEKTDIKIFPNKQWVLSFNKNISDVMKFSETTLKIEYAYKSIGTRIAMWDKEENIIDFNNYGFFLLYLSEIDELKNSMNKNLTEVTTICNDIRKYLNE